MGKATEHLAEKMGAGIGGLLNATFGNAAELIIAALALHKGLHGVVKASITGSIIGNVLLVLGLSVLVGGAKFTQQRFNRTAAGIGFNAPGTQRCRSADSRRYSTGSLKIGCAVGRLRKRKRRCWSGD